MIDQIPNFIHMSTVDACKRWHQMFYANGEVVSDAYFMAFRSSVAFICGVIFCEFYLFIFALSCPCVQSSSLWGLENNYGKHTFPR